MKISPIISSSFASGQMNSGNVQKSSPLTFKGIKNSLVPVSIDVFKTGTAKQMYSKIQKYLKILGDSGRVNNVKILSEDGRYFNSRLGTYFDSKADVFLSINKDIDKSRLQLSRKYLNNVKPVTLLDAEFNKDGLMMRGSFPPENMLFERSNNNLRRLSHNNGDYVMKSIWGNDREWAGGLPTYLLRIDNSTSGAYEIFIELARLYTSILK